MKSNASAQADVADPAITEAIADFALAGSFASLPAEVQRESVRTVVNWVGCALGGAPTPTVEAAIKGLQSYSSPGRCRVLGRRECFDAPGAAVINCLGSAAYAFDDTHLATITHPTGPVISSLLALAESQTIRGEDFLTALMIGMEIECRLSTVIVAPSAGSSGGWYITGVTGSIGAAAAVGRVLGLNRDAMVSALGLAAAQSCGTRGTHASMACAYVPAIAAQAGFVAAMMARAGFECGPAAVAGRNGVVEVIAPKADHGAICRDFGKHWEVLGNAYKPYPCGIVIHSAIDACLELVRKHKQNPDDIAEVAFDVTPGALALCWRKLPDFGTGSAGQSLSLARRNADSRRGDRHAGAACLHSGSARPRTAVAAQRDVQSRARDRSGQGRDAHARPHHAFGEHRARRRQFGQTDVGRRIECEVSVAGTWRSRRRCCEEAARRVVERARARQRSGSSRAWGGIDRRT